MTNKVGLFQTGTFTLASGQVSSFKIECDVLTNGEWEGLATMIYNRCGDFSEVVGIPRGGLKLAEKLKPYAKTGVVGLPRLLVDDVYTTGGTIEKYYLPGDIVWVVFGRMPIKHPYVKSLFQLNNEDCFYREANTC